METQLLLATFGGIALLLLLVIKFKINAFISLLVSSIIVGLAAGVPAQTIIESIQNGMGGTLGFVATVVGLGAIFGQILEHFGGAKALAKTMLRKCLLGHDGHRFLCGDPGFF